MRTAIFPAKYEDLDGIRTFAEQAAKDAGLTECEVYEVQLAVDEACTNIIEHAYGIDVMGDIEITCNASADGLTIILRDHGKPFSPNLIILPDRSADVKKHKVGGLGLYIIYRLMEDVSFEPAGESGNLLTMVKRHREGR